MKSNPADKPYNYFIRTTLSKLTFYLALQRQEDGITFQADIPEKLTWIGLAIIISS